MKVLFNENKNIIFDDFLQNGYSLDKDFFRDYFQEEHSNRGDLKQDYTPDSICTIISMLSRTCGSVTDVCSGTGALTIFDHIRNNSKHYTCIEVSKRSLPILLFNLSIRGMAATVYHQDVLTREITQIYKMKRNGRYSDIELVLLEEDIKSDIVISNPPYSLQWNPKHDERFEGYELAPKSKADYSFILDCLYRLNEQGKAFIVLPHGVLFRGSQEYKIRRKLIENNLIDSIIGLPSNMFMNTQIPVCIMCLNKDKRTNDVLFIDASKMFFKDGKYNKMTDDDIKKIIDAFNNRKNIDKLSHVASNEELIENDYNLNIPRYVDTFEYKEPPKLNDVISGLIETEEKIKQAKKELCVYLKELQSNPSNGKDYRNEIERLIKLWDA